MSSNGPSCALTLASPALLAYRLCTVNATTTVPLTLGFACTAAASAAQAARRPAPQQQVPLVRDVADHVAHLVERTLQQALGCALAERERDVAGAVVRAAGEQGEERVGHRLLEPCDGGHAREAQGDCFE